MITHGAITATACLADKITSAGYMLEPFMGDSNPLSVLVGCSYTPILENSNMVVNEYDSVLENVVATTSTNNQLGICEHDVALSEVSKMIAEAVRADIHTAKNVVNPLVIAAAEEVQKVMQEKRVKLASVISIIPNMYEAIWSSSLLSDLALPYADIPALTVNSLPDVHPPVSKEILLTLLKTGASKFDKEILDWVSQISIDFVMDVYNKVFLAPSYRDGETLPNLEYLLTTDPIGRNRTLVIFLLARRLPIDIMEGIDMTAGDYELMMASVASQSGRVLNRVTEERDRNNRLKVLVMSWPLKDAEFYTEANDCTNIVVNMDVYEKWLESGGTPQILYGAAVSDHCNDPAELIANRELYEKRWDNRNAVIVANHEAKRYSYTVGALQLAISRQIAELDDGILGTTSRAELNARLVEQMSKVSHRCITDIFECTRRLVCDVIFPNSNAKRILQRMDELSRENRNYGPREAGLIAMIEIVTNWVCNLIVVSKAK